MSTDLSNWIEVCKFTDLPAGEREFVDLEDDTRVLVTNVAGNVYAVESMCSHAMFELDDAEIEGDHIICPLHGAHFCLKSGKVLSAPAIENLVSFPVKINNDVIYILDNRD